MLALDLRVICREKTMRHEVTKETRIAFDQWRKEQDAIVAEKQKKMERFKGQEGYLPYYGASGGSISYTLYLGTKKASARHYTGSIFEFELIDFPKIASDYQVKLDEWKASKDHDQLALCYTPTTLGDAVELVDLKTQERYNITDYDSW